MPNSELSLPFRLMSMPLRLYYILACTDLCCSSSSTLNKTDGTVIKTKSKVFLPHFPGEPWLQWLDILSSTPEDQHRTEHVIPASGWQGYLNKTHLPTTVIFVTKLSGEGTKFFSAMEITFSPGDRAHSYFW